MDIKIASGHYLNVYIDSLYEGAAKDIFIFFNESNDAPTIDELEKIKAIVKSELRKDPRGTDLQQVIEETGLPCVRCGVRVISSIKSSYAIYKKASSLIDRNPSLSNAIYKQKDMEYAMEDIRTRINDNFKEINVDDLSSSEIKKIVKRFKNTLGANGTFWDVYWESADYAIEEYLEERKVNLPLYDRVKEAQRKVCEGNLEKSRAEGPAR